jgi:hypothetical protein
MSEFNNDNANNGTNKNPSTNPYLQLYSQMERVIADKSTKPYTKSFAILFCILFEVVINIDCKKEVAFHSESCETLLANYFHHLCEVLQTGSIEEDASSSDFKELRVIVGLVQEDIATPSAHNKKTIDLLVSRACEN